MNKQSRRAILIIGTTLTGMVISLTEPATFLDQQISELVLKAMLAQNRGEAIKIVLPFRSSENEIAQRILQLKNEGLRGIILSVPTKRIKGGTAIQAAIASENVVWVANPAEIESALARQATCRPLIVCQEFGSAMLVKSENNALRSATVLALTCSEDIATFKRLGTKPFKLLFRRGSYEKQAASTNTILACVTLDDTRERVRYPTPAGLKTPAEYTVDICQALLDRKYLVETGISLNLMLAALASALFVCVRRRTHQLIALLLILSVLFGIAVLAKVQLPIGTVLLIYVFILVATPIFSIGQASRLSSRSETSAADRQFVEH